MNETHGRKEVGQAVTIAALTTLANGLIQWGIDTAKAKAEERKKRKALETAQQELERKAKEAVKAAQECQREAAQQETKR